MEFGGLSIPLSVGTSHLSLLMLHVAIRIWDQVGMAKYYRCYRDIKPPPTAIHTHMDLLFSIPFACNITLIWDGLENDAHTT